MSAVARSRISRMPLPPAPVEPIVFGRDNAFTMKVATEETDRLKCWRLVYEQYLAHGYTQEKEIPYRYSAHDALPNAATFLIQKDGHPAGTVTVYPDSSLGLPADEVYRDELDALRRGGRRLTEVGRLTIARGFVHDHTIMPMMCDLLMLFARNVRRATDLVITVNPTHAMYYEKKMLFERVGQPKDMGSVCGAAAVLLKLDLELKERVTRSVHGEGAPVEGVEGRRTIYRYFSPREEENRRVAWLKRSLRPPSEEFLMRYFVILRPIIPNLSPGFRHFFETCYPDYVLERREGLPAVMPGASETELTN
jgi:hypothetical protein